MDLNNHELLSESIVGDNNWLIEYWELRNKNPKKPK